MDMRKRRDAQLAYIADEKTVEEIISCRKILQKLNFMDRSDSDGIAQVVKELLGKHLYSRTPGSSRYKKYFI